MSTAIKSTALDIRYATLKAVKNFFGTKATAIQFPSIDAFDLSDPDQQKFLKTVKKLPFETPSQKSGERKLKPVFSFGRCLVSMSKNAPDYALAQCSIYLTEYPYDLGDGKIEKRAQIIIAPPVENEDEDDLTDLSFLGTKPQIADDDEDEAFADDEETDEDEKEEPAPKAKSRKK